MSTDPPDELQHALRQAWNIPSVGSGEDLREALARRVAHLLRHDMQRLISAMYLLDVSEERFNAAYNAGDIETAAGLLADIILEREERKMASRRAYRRANSIDVEAGSDGEPHSRGNR